MEIVNIQDYIPPKDKLRKVTEDNLNYLDYKFLYILLLLFASGGILSMLNKSYHVAIPMTVLSMGLYVVGYIYLKNRHHLRLLLVLVLFLFELQLFIQFEGSGFVYYYYFILITSLILYKDGRYILIFYLLSVLLLIGTPLFLSRELLYDELLNAEFSILKVFFDRNFFLNLSLYTMHLLVCAITSLYLYEQASENAKQKVYLEEYLHMEANVELIKQITEGKLEEFYPYQNNDIMGRHLLAMRDNLIELKEKDEIQKWVSSGLASISDLLLTVDRLDRLSNKVMRELVTFMHCYQGGLFLYNDDDPKAPYLELASAYAFNKRQQLDRRVELGEGMVGEVAIRKKTEFIEDIPENFEPISSGLGDSPPKSILIVPLKVKDELIGVIEVSSFKNFQKHEIEFLNQVSESIAVTILSLKSRIKTDKLLEESQKYNDQLISKENALKEQMAEVEEAQMQMKAKQKELEISNIRMSAILDGSNDGILSFDSSGKIFQKNASAVAIFEFDDQENTEVLISRIFAQEDFNKAIDKQCRLKAQTLNGRIFTAEVFINQYTNEKDETISIAYVQDITEEVKREKEIKKLLDEAQKNNQTLREQEETIRQNMEMMGDLYDELSEKYEETSVKLSTLNSWISSIEGCIYSYDLTDEGKKLHYISDEIKIVSGYTKEEIGVDPDWNHVQLIEENDRSSFLEKMNEVETEIDHQGTYELMYRIKSKSGDPVWVEEILKITTNKNGQRLQVGVIYKVHSPI